MDGKAERPTTTPIAGYKRQLDQRSPAEIEGNSQKKSNTENIPVPDYAETGALDVEQSEGNEGGNSE